MTDWLDFLWYAEYPAMLAGIVYLIAHRRRCPRAARVGAAALAFLLAFNLLTNQLPRLFPGMEGNWIDIVAGWAGANRLDKIHIRWALGTAVRTGCLLLLAWAAVLGRPPAEPDSASE